MDKIIVWHNPRCRKSREGLAAAQKVAEEKALELEIRKYLDNPPDEKELKNILKMLKMNAMDLVRSKEAIWKENFKGKDLSEKEVIQAMAKYPKLIERPVVIFGDKAVLARPAEKVYELL